jgi:hypothetical protein
MGTFFGNLPWARENILSIKNEDGLAFAVWPDKNIGKGNRRIISQLLKLMMTFCRVAMIFVSPVMKREEP